MGRDKRPSAKFEIKLAIPPKLLLRNTYKQATQLTLTEGLVKFENNFCLSNERGEMKPTLLLYQFICK